MNGLIRHLPAARRFTTQVDGVECVLDYRYDEAARVMTVIHTGVPASVGGRGIAGALVQAAFDTARAEGWKVRPTCSYAASWLARHPVYHDLLG